MCKINKIILAFCLFVSLTILPVLGGCAEKETSIHKESESTPTYQKESSETFHKSGN